MKRKRGRGKAKKKELKRIINQMGRFSSINRRSNRAEFVLGSQFIGGGLKMLDQDIGLTRKSRKKVKRREKAGRALRRGGKAAAGIGIGTSLSAGRYLDAGWNALSGATM